MPKRVYSIDTAIQAPSHPSVTWFETHPRVQRRKPNPAFRLTELPVDVRIMIYERLIPQDKIKIGIAIDRDREHVALWCWYEGDNANGPDPASLDSHAILSTNKQIRDEAYSAIFTHLFKFVTPTVSSVRYRVGYDKEPQPPSKFKWLQFIKSIKIKDDLEGFEGFNLERIFPKLESTSFYVEHGARLWGTYDPFRASQVSRAHHVVTQLVLWLPRRFPLGREMEAARALFPNLKEFKIKYTTGHCEDCPEPVYAFAAKQIIFKAVHRQFDRVKEHKEKYLGEGRCQKTYSVSKCGDNKDLIVTALIADYHEIGYDQVKDLFAHEHWW